MTTKTKVEHTPGPWSVCQDSLSFPALLVRAKQCDKAIADCDYQDGEEGQANARLIAAAPELLEVLVSLHVLALQSDLNNPEDRWVIDAAYAAIRKARGE